MKTIKIPFEFEMVLDSAIIAGYYPYDHVRQIDVLIMTEWNEMCTIFERL